MPEKLFSYGTLQLENVQLKNFGRVLSSKPDILPKYELRDCLITDAEVISASGKSIHPIACFTNSSNDSISGAVFEITDDELTQSDKYEVDDYKRIKCTLLSGENAWVYVQNGLHIDTQFLIYNDIKLETFQDAHIPLLCEKAKEAKIWQFHRNDFEKPNKFEQIAIHKAKNDIAKKKRYMFCINYKNEIIGSTSYYDINLDHLRMTIGYTWMHPDYWGLGINKVIKHLMLNYAFNHLKFKRVDFCIDSENKRSRSAIEKLKIPLEGILKNHQIRPDGSQRDSAIYAITNESWRSDYELC